MMSYNKYFFLFLGIFIFTGFMVSVSFAQPRVGRRVAPATEGTVSDSPQIGEFSARPTRLARREDIVFRWNVTSFSGGSPVTNVKLTSGAINLHETSNLSGEYTFAHTSWMYRSIFPNDARGTQKFSIFATNQAGRISRRDIDIQVVSLSPVIENFSVNPTPTIVQGETVYLNWRVSPGESGIAIRSVVITRSMPPAAAQNIYSGADLRGERREETSSSAIPGPLNYTITATNEENVTATRTVNNNIVASGVIRERPDLTVEVIDLRWRIDVPSPFLEFRVRVNNIGEFRAENVTVRIMAWRGRGEYLYENFFTLLRYIQPGENKEQYWHISSEELRGSTEVYVRVDPGYGYSGRDRIAESREDNNSVSVRIPPMPTSR